MPPDTDMQRVLAAMATAGNAGGLATLRTGGGGVLGTVPLQQPVAAVDTRGAYVGPWTVTLGLIENEWINAPFTLQIRAFVRWGHDGAAFEAELDWKRGSVFVVHGSYVQVFVKVNNSLAAITAIAASNVCTAAITPGAASPGGSWSSGPTLTEMPIGATAPAGTCPPIRIPPFAVSFVILQGQASADAVCPSIVRHLAGDAVAVLCFTEQVSSISGAGQMQGIPTPAHHMARFISVQNIGASNADFQVVWQLRIG
jgi:hypothetical protein